MYPPLRPLRLSARDSRSPRLPLVRASVLPRRPARELRSARALREARVRCEAAAPEGMKVKATIAASVPEMILIFATLPMLLTCQSQPSKHLASSAGWVSKNDNWRSFLSRALYELGSRSGSESPLDYNILKQSDQCERA